MRSTLITMKRLFFALIFLFYAAQAEATIWYVRTGGSDAHNCTEAQTNTDGNAKQTINAALACVGFSPGAGANHFVQVNDGIYTSGIGPELPSGASWSAPFTIVAPSGATIRASNTNNIVVYLPTNANLFTIIQGFTLDGANLANNPQASIGTNDDGPGFLRIIGNEFINTEQFHAIMVAQFSHHVEIINNKIHTGAFADTSGGGCCGYALYLRGKDNLIEGNEIYNVPSWGIHAYSFSNDWPDRNVVRRNYIHDFGSGDSRAGGILIDRGDANQLYRNIVYNGAAGIQVGPNASNTVVDNNTVNGNTEGIQLEGDDITVRNNAATSNATNIVVRGGNPSFTTNFCTDSGGTTGCSINGSSAGYVNSNGGNFSLTSGSPLIDRGIAVVNGCANGPAPDIGAIETMPNPTATVNGTAFTIILSNNCTSQILPASAVTGFSFRKGAVADSISTIARGAGNSFVGTLASAFVAGNACDFSYSQASGNVFSDNNIGNVSTSNQELLAFTNIACTNQSGGAVPNPVTLKLSAAGMKIGGGVSVKTGVEP
jgi:parallel beta-helix repeat protein